MGRRHRVGHHAVPDNSRLSGSLSKAERDIRRRLVDLTRELHHG